MQIQTSTAGLPITLLWGTNKLAPNLIDARNFIAWHKKSGKGGKGGGKGSSTTEYYASIVLGLCEGPIQSVGRVFSNNSVTTLATLWLSYQTGTPSQPATIDDMAYANTANLYAAIFDLGTSATLPSMNFEIMGVMTGSIPPRPDGYDVSHDANFADIIWDFIGNPRYGLDPDMLPYVDSTTHDDYKNYCQGQCLMASPMIDSQDQALSILQRWATLSNTWIFWSGTALKFKPLSWFPVSDGLVFWNPDINPIYDLGYDDFVFESASKDQDPITFERLDPRDGYNRVEVDCIDRNNYYDSNPQYWEDLASVQEFGQLQSQTVSASEICDPNVAKVIASLVGQRMTSIRNTYSFKLGYSYILLEPGDLVTITEPNIGLVRFPVRITEVAEDDKGNLDVKAEEFPYPVGATAFAPDFATTMPNQPVSIFDPGIDQYADPGDVNQPMIIEPPASVTGGPPEVWIGASGGSSWGGAEVWLSIDGLNYADSGTISQPTAQGVLQNPLPMATTDPDNTNTLSVDMQISGMALPTGITHGDADAGTTASTIDDEVLSWGTVASTGSNTYNLTYLRRPQYQSVNEAHLAGAVFSRVDPSVVVKYSLPTEWIGKTIYVKLTSFNTFGQRQQDIADVTAYTYTPKGTAYTINPPTGIALEASTVVQGDGSSLIDMTTSWTASTGPSLGNYEVQYSNDSGVTWTAADASVGSASTSYVLAPAVPSTNYQSRVRAISANGLAQSSWDTSLVVFSGTGGSGGGTVPARPTGLTATAGNSQVALAWSANAGTDGVTSYKVYRAPGLSQAFTSAALIATVSGGTLGYNDTGLPTGGQYTYFLVATNATGNSVNTAGVNATVPTPTMQNRFAPYYSLQVRKPNSAEILFSLPIDYTVQFQGNFAGSRGDIDGVAPTATVTFQVLRNGSSVGTVVFPSGSVGRNLATFTTTGGAVVTFNPGDELAVQASVTVDATFQGFNFSLEGLH
jgi:hypothetical protein